MVHKFFDKEAPRIQHDILYLDGKEAFPGQGLHTPDIDKRETFKHSTEVRSQFLREHSLAEMGSDTEGEGNVLGKITRRNIALNEHEVQG